MSYYNDEIVEKWVDDLVGYYNYEDYTKEDIEESFWDNVSYSCEDLVKGLSNEECLDIIADNQFFDWEDLQDEGLNITNFQTLLYYMYYQEVRENEDDILNGIYERLGLDDVGFEQ